MLPLSTSAMLSRRVLMTALRSGRKSAVVQVRCMGGGAGHGHEPDPPPIVKVDIGTRDVVGFGMNGEETYIDNVHFPFPAIRFKEDTAEITMLKEKEKGDWKKLTMEEKKALYRASYCQTFAEIEAPTGEWKSVFGLTLILVSVGLWMFIWIKLKIMGDLPSSLTDEAKVRQQIQFMIDNRVGAVDGFASNYDYEKGEWKNKKK